MSASRDVLRAVNAVIIPGFLGTELPAWLAQALEEGLAGVVYFGQNISDHTAELSAQIYARQPAAIIAVDEEGGAITRLEAVHGSTLPGAAQLGVLDDVRLSGLVGTAIAARCAEVGINLSFAPVADVNTNRANPVIGVRSFGADPAVVSRHVSAEVHGMQASGLVAACAKHFPGHGDTHTDSHLSLPELTIPPSEIEAVHFAPFRAAIAAGVKMIMTAHIRVPAWGDAPATLNPVVLGKLRELGFEGVIVTDALDMAAIREGVGVGPGAVAAIKAGADALCIGNPRTNLGGSGSAQADYEDYVQVRDALIAAVTSGELSLETLRRAGERTARLGGELARERLRGGAAVPRPAEPDWSQIIAPAITAHGDVCRPNPVLVLGDMRGRATLAVASESDAFVRCLRGKRTVVPVAAADLLLDTPHPLPPDSALIVLVDRIGGAGAQRTDLERLAARYPRIVAVNAGVMPEPGALPGIDRIDALAGSLISATIVAGLIAGPTR